MTRRVWLGALLLAVLGVEALAWLRPSALPAVLGVPARLRKLDAKIYRRDPELGHCLAPAFEGLGVRHEPLPGGAPCGRRVAAGDASSRGTDIAILGDSHVYGMEAADEAVWTTRLARLSGLRVANLGVRAYGTAQAVELYRRYGSRLEPRLVLVLLCPNDPWDDAVYEDWLRRKDFPPSFVADELFYRVCRALRLEEHPLACRAAAQFGRLGLTAHLLLGRLVALRYGSASMGQLSPESLAPVVGALKELRGLAKGRKLAAVLNEGWPDEARKLLQRELRQAEIPLLELSGGKGHRVPLDGHWNDEGHRRTAELVHRFLADEGLLPRSGAYRTTTSSPGAETLRSRPSSR